MKKNPPPSAAEETAPTPERPSAPPPVLLAADDDTLHAVTPAPAPALAPAETAAATAAPADPAPAAPPPPSAARSRRRRRSRHVTEENEDEVENEEDSKEDNDAGSDYELPGPLWQGWLLGLVPLVVIMFGSGREAWSKGLAAVLVALLLLVFPARRKLPTMASACLLAALAAPLLSFLPSSWQLLQPEWRATLENDWGIILSKTLTPQAWVTWEAWLIFALCLVWLGWCVARGFSSAQRRGLLQALTLGGMFICAMSILERQHVLALPWWPRNFWVWGESFGPFANRNHTSSLAAILCLLSAAAAYDAHRRRSRMWAIYALGMLLPLACIFINTSKAGVVLLFVGFTTWFGTVAMRKSFFQKMTMAATLICVIATLIVMSEGGITARVKSGEATSIGGRGALFMETLSMATHAPWLGVGLGNFDGVFPMLSSMHEPRSRFLHPESDLLWLLAEGGLLTLVPAGLLVLWIFNATGPWFGKKKKGASSRLDRRLRNAAAIAFGLGALHGLADVPNHGLGYALFMSLLAGMAVRPRRLRQESRWTGRLAFRLAGLAVLALGIAWLGVALGHATLPGSSTAQSLRTRASQMVDSGSLADAMPLMNEALRLKPLAFEMYYERARLRLMAGGSKEDALMDFSRSRTLEPHYAGMCYTEGVTWTYFDPQYAVIGWREYLKRYPASAPGIHGYYRQMLHYASLHPQLREPLWSLAESPDLKLDFLASVTTREEFDRCLRSLLALRPHLEGLEASQRETLFELWGRLGDEKALITSLETNKKWRDDGWRLLAAYHARNSDFRSACQTAAAYLPSLNRATPGSIVDIPSLERALLYNPTDVRIGVDLFQSQKSTGDLDGAIRTLEKVIQLPNPPTYIRQELAALHAAKGDFRRAWEHYQEAMQRRAPQD
ncbi:MAG: O-antigen ligase family protein [Prosthecobacter sp.]